jgi:hypothetical protein
MTSLLPFDSSNQDANMSCGSGFGRKAEMRTLILAERAARRAREFSKTHVDE